MFYNYNNRNSRNVLKFVFLLFFSVQLSFALEIPSTPRSLGMGGVGVAVGNGSLAPIVNPALMSFSSAFVSGDTPSIGLAVRYPKSIFSDISYLRDHQYVFKNLANLLNNKTNITRSQADQAISDVDDILQHLNFINDPVDTVESNTFSITSTKVNLFSFVPSIGIGFYMQNANHFALKAGKLLQDSYKDFDNMETTLIAMSGLNTEFPNPPGDNSGPTPLHGNNQNKSLPLPLNLPKVNPDFYSTVSLNSLYYSINDIGIALSGGMDFSWGKISLGVTPKYQYVYANFSKLALGDIKNVTSFFKNSKATVVRKSLFNANVGIAYAVDSLIPGTIYLGGAVQNVFSHTISSSLGKITINPLYTVGVGYNYVGFTISSDVDLNSIKAPEFYGIIDPSMGYDSRKWRVGGEYTFFKILSFRAGEILSLTGKLNPQTTAGIGLNPGIFKIELSGLYAPANYGMNVSFGFIF